MQDKNNIDNKHKQQYTIPKTDRSTINARLQANRGSTSPNPLLTAVIVVVVAVLVVDVSDS